MYTRLADGKNPTIWKMLKNIKQNNVEINDAKSSLD